jgi:hypothetical protein
VLVGVALVALAGMVATGIGRAGEADRDAATLTVTVDANDRHDFRYSVSGPAGREGVGGAGRDAVLDDDHDPARRRSVTFTGLGPDRYTVTQARAPGWDLVDATCDDGTSADLAARGATVRLGRGDRVTCTFRPALERPLVGAIRWDAWHDGLVGREVEYTLAPPEWRNRLPWFAEVSPSGAVRTRADDPKVAAEEIARAARLGIDYFAFLWYDSDRAMGSEDEGMMRGLRYYRASPDRDRVKYTVVVDGDRLADPGERATILRYMRDPNWVTVAGRPLIFVGLWADPARTDVEALRAASRAQGTGDPYVVQTVIGASSPSGIQRTVRTADAAGGDAVSWYSIAVPSAQGGPYPLLAGTAREAWGRAARLGTPVVPTAMAGWDPRPRVARPPFWGDSGRSWFRAPTPAELGRHLGEAVDWAATTGAPAVLVYAWNEYDEGGWLAPTLVPDPARQDAIREALVTRR